MRCGNKSFLIAKRKKTTLKLECLQISNNNLIIITLLYMLDKLAFPRTIRISVPIESLCQSRGTESTFVQQDKIDQPTTKKRITTTKQNPCKQEHLCKLLIAEIKNQAADDVDSRGNFQHPISLVSFPGRTPTRTNIFYQKPRDGGIGADQYWRTGANCFRPWKARTRAGVQYSTGTRTLNSS